MSNQTIRPAYSTWPEYNRRLRDVVAAMTEERLAIRPSPERWPLWATIGHTACQRVFWLCDFAGEPGAETTPFTNAGHDCPGDDDLEHVLTSAALADALDSTFHIVERCLDRWTLPMLDEVIRRPEWDESWVHTRGAVIQRVFSHDIYHAAELNESLGIAGLPLIDFWDRGSLAALWSSTPTQRRRVRFLRIVRNAATDAGSARSRPRIRHRPSRRAGRGRWTVALLTDSGPGNAEGPWTITFDRLSGGTNDLVGPWVLEFDGP